MHKQKVTLHHVAIFLWTLLCQGLGILAGIFGIFWIADQAQEHRWLEQLIIVCPMGLIMALVVIAMVGVVAMVGGFLWNTWENTRPRP